MSLNNIDFSKKYTVSELESWEDVERWELVNGTPYMLASPSFEHEDISTQLRTIFNSHVRNFLSNCRVYGDPAGIILDDNDDKLVRPDLFVVCSPNVKNGRMYGIPIIAIEILSKSTASYDVHVKKRLYEKNGVQEYWIIDPIHQLVQVYHLLNKNEYEFIGQYSKEEVINVKTIDGLEVKLSDVFLLE